MTDITNLLPCPCPCCGSTNITSNEWTVDEDHARQFDADEHSEIWAFECSDCLAGAPAQSWQNRRDPWRYPPAMPEEGQRILQTYRCDDGTESPEVISVWRAAAAQHWRPLVRWMPIQPPEPAPPKEPEPALITDELKVHIQQLGVWSVAIGRCCERQELAQNRSALSDAQDRIDEATAQLAAAHAALCGVPT